MSAAQSNGPNPGASATFSRNFFDGALVVVGGTPRDPAPVGGGIKPDDGGTLNPERGLGAPGTRRALAGNGGGGIVFESVKTLGSADEPDFGAGILDEDPRRWALLSAGNAGGVSVRSESASESCSSSALGADTCTETSGSSSSGLGAAVWSDEPASQLLRYADMVVNSKCQSLLTAPELLDISHHGDFVALD